MTALATIGLSLNFGALAVTRDVTFTLPGGARHALIGPNGAGKTTLINLLTGFYRPVSGRVMMGGDDVTGLAMHQRARRGLARTYQINTLFADLTPLESVTLAIAERDGIAGAWHRRLGSCRSEAEEAYDLLDRLGLGDEAGRPTRHLPYGRQRLLEIALALASRPKVLLLDEPAAGVPARESAELFEAIAALPGDVAVLFIEHDMDLVFRFAERITVLVAGAVLCEGSAAEIAEDERVREVYLGRAGHG